MEINLAGLEGIPVGLAQERKYLSIHEKPKVVNVDPKITFHVREFPFNCGIAVIAGMSSNIIGFHALDNSTKELIYEYVHDGIIREAASLTPKKLVMSDKVHRPYDLSIYNICKHNGWSAGPITRNPNHDTFVRTFEWTINKDRNEVTEEYALSTV